MGLETILIYENTVSSLGSMTSPAMDQFYSARHGIPTF